MSRNDWERGTIKITAPAWPQFKKTLREAWNRIQDQKLGTAVTLHAKLLAAAANQRNFDWKKAATALVESQIKADRHIGENGCQSLWDIVVILLPHGRPAVGTPLVPTRKHFPLATGATATFNFGEAHIGLQEEQKTVIYSSGENNHAVETARQHAMAISLFTALKRITWTRGSGGELAGNDEYNCEDHGSGGGANYTTARYGVTQNPPIRRAGHAGTHRSHTQTMSKRR